MSRARDRELLQQNRLLVRQESLAERDVAKVIRAVAADVAARVTYGDEQASLQIVDSHRPAMAAALEKRLKQTALLFGARTLERIAGVMPKSYYAGLAPGTGPVRGDAGDLRELKDAREVFEAAILQWVQAHALERATSIMGTIKEAVRAVLVESFADGTGEAGTVKLIRERIGRRLSASNAARIARTEMHTAATIGADHAARSTGLEMIKEWASAEDSRTRPSHSAADGQEVPLNDAFRVGAVLLMVPGDPTGPAKEIINCRCAVLHHPLIGGQVIRADGRPGPIRAPEPETAPAAISIPLVFSNPLVTNDTVKVRSRKDVNKALKARLATAAADDRYSAAPEFRGRKPSQWGASPFGSAAWDDEAASMIADIVPELDAMADALKIPRIRGYVTLGSRSRAHADMGDGVMGLNPETFNRRAGLIGARATPEARAVHKARMAELREHLTTRGALISQLKEDFMQARRAGRADEVNEIRDRLRIELEKHEEHRKAYMEAARRANPMGIGDESKPASSWKPGDPVKERPFSVSKHQEPGIDRARSTLYHEFGHHVHQYLGKTGRRPPEPPMETKLRALYREAKEEGRLNRNASEYSTANHLEWFAENFSLFTLGKRGLVDPVLADFIKELFDAAR